MGIEQYMELGQDLHIPHPDFTMMGISDRAIIDVTDSLIVVKKMVAYTNAFMLNGGSHIQYNMVDTNELRDDKIHPEKHEDLIVRIGGFSAYFTQLSLDIQDDVTNRNEHSL